MSYTVVVMEEQTSLKYLHDFVTETQGRCFLCSENSSRVESDSSANPSSIYSLHCLARYLKIDMTKVFTGSGPIPSHLADRVAKSRLKSELCEECVELTEKFSKLYRQLEKVEMEMGSCLAVIHGKLDNRYKAGDWNNDGSKDEWMAKLEITEALRKDTMQKCSVKKSALLPATKIERLTPKQVNAIAVKLKVESKSTSRISQRSCQQSELKFEDEHAGSHASSVSVASNEDGSHHLELEEHPIQSPMELDKYVAGNDLKVKQEVVEETSYSNVPELKLHHQTPSTTIINSAEGTRTATNANVKDNELGHLSKTIPPPIEVTDPDATKKSKMSQYQCQTCKKNFGSHTNYRRHYLGVHIGVRYKCSECGKTFVEKSHLKYHQNSVHLGKSFECKHCSRTFPMPHHRNRHMKSCAGQRI